MSSSKLGIKRSAVVLGVVALVATGVAWVATNATVVPTISYRNVVLVTIDTLRADHLGTYGYPRPTSPFLDSLARQGVVFEDVQASSSHTAPSHATMFTSLYPEAHGVLINGTALPPEIDTLAGLLGRTGFETAAFTSVGFLKLLGAGFDHFDASHRPAGETADAALEWLAAERSGTPTFLWLHFFDVHQHQIVEGPHQEFVPRIKDSTMREPREFRDYLRRTGLKGRLTGRLRRHLLHYDARIAYVDAQIERLFEIIQNGGLVGDTLWVITADHGEGLGNHNTLGHGRRLYGEQLRVPLIVYPAPSKTAGARIEGMVRLLDLRPTIADLLGVEDLVAAEQVEGVSLAPTIWSPRGSVEIEYSYAQRRPHDQQRSSLGWERGLVLAARRDNQKYIYYETKPDEYYDLSVDPNESVNLADQDLRQARALREWLLENYQRMHAVRSEQENEIQPEVLEELKALGYVD